MESKLSNPVRLACIRPAASVHPEPGSNSPLYKCFVYDPDPIFTQKIEICSCLLGAWRLVHGVTALLHAPCASRILSTVSLFLLKLTVLIVVSRLQLFISNLATSDLELKTQDFYQPRCALLIIPIFLRTLLLASRFGLYSYRT